jgi:hypothetical protein
MLIKKINFLWAVLLVSCVPASIVEDQAKVLDYLFENYEIRIPEPSKIGNSCLWLNERDQGVILVFLRITMDEEKFMDFLSSFDNQSMLIQEKQNPWVPQQYEGIDWWNPEKLDFAKKATIWKMPNNREDGLMEVSFFENEVYLFFRGRSGGSDKGDPKE